MPASLRICSANGVWYPGPAGIETLGTDAAGRTIDQIHTQRQQLFRQADGIVNGPSALHPIRRGNAHEQWKTRRPRQPDGLHHFAQNARPVFKRPSVAIGARIAQWRKKLVQQISVRRRGSRRSSLRLRAPASPLRRMPRRRAQCLQHLTPRGLATRRKKESRWERRWAASPASDSFNAPPPFHGTARCWPYVPHAPTASRAPRRVLR